MQITVKSALEMLAALGQLDSYQNGADKPTLYKYDGETRLALAMARRKLRGVAEDYQQARNALLLEVTDGAGELPPISNAMTTEHRQAVLAKHMDFDKGDKELQAAMVELNIAPLAAARLKLDDNPIPAGVLDMLGDFIAV